MSFSNLCWELDVIGLNIHDVLVVHRKPPMGQQLMGRAECPFPLELIHPMHASAPIYQSALIDMLVPMMAPALDRLPAPRQGEITGADSSSGTDRYTGTDAVPGTDQNAGAVEGLAPTTL